MEQSPKPKRRLLPWSGATIVVVAFLVITILPAFIAFALTPQDAQVVTNVQGWNGCAYTVRRGDNLFRIGVRHGVTYQYLAQLNGIENANYVWAGQIISVPCGTVPYPNYNRWSATPIPYKCPWCKPFDIPANCGNTISYDVQPGDNLFRIAVTNGSTIQWIRTQNGLWGKVLRSGTTIQVPCQNYVKDYPTLEPLTPGQPTGIITATSPALPSITPSNNTINMKNGRFRPNHLDIKVGTTVTWVNAEASSGPAYDVTSGANGQPDNTFMSGGPIAPGATYQFTFSVSGIYSFYSSTDAQNMTGQVVVSP